MAQLVETGRLTLEDIRELEDSLAKLESSRKSPARGRAKEKQTNRGMADECRI